MNQDPGVHRARLVVLGAIGLAVFLSALEQAILGPALPTIDAELPGSMGLSWLVTSYLLAATATAPVIGKLGDLFGRRRLLFVSLWIFVAGSVLCAVAQSLVQLVLARALQGIGGGGLIAVPFALLADTIPPRERGRYQGYVSAAFGVAAILGPTAGGLFAEHTGWRWIFWINVPLTALAMGAALRGIPPDVPGTRKVHVDGIGAALIVATTTAVLWPIAEAQALAAHGGSAFLPFVLATALLFVATRWQERRSPEPIVPARLLRNASFRGSAAMLGFATLAQLGLAVFMPVFLQGRYGLEAGTAGLVIAPVVLAVTLGSVVTGVVIARSGAYRGVTVVGLATSCIVTAIYALGAGVMPLAVALVLLAFGGAGAGTAFVVSLISMQNAIERADMGAATAALGVFRNVGGALGIAAFGMLAGSGTRTLELKTMLGAATVAYALAWMAAIRLPVRPLGAPTE